MPEFRQVLLPKTIQVLGQKNVTTTLQKYVDDTQKIQETAVKIFENHVNMVQISKQSESNWPQNRTLAGKKFRLVRKNFLKTTFFVHRL